MTDILEQKPRNALPCQGCANGTDHTMECSFSHFLNYTGFNALDTDIIAKLRVAYEHGADQS